ncbi:MAG: hypothetical protein PHT44_01200 [Candidatus Portnoybacteria bacterium]|nr:hypothetical protein [Candidatus Portnoybacteria bacterium]MDD4982779.1 hypothetical protein [Candidatus Portnoybacteria bacterium]
MAKITLKTVTIKGKSDNKGFCFEFLTPGYTAEAGGFYFEKWPAAAKEKAYAKARASSGPDKITKITVIPADTSPWAKDYLQKYPSPNQRKLVAAEIIAQQLLQKELDIHRYNNTENSALEVVQNFAQGIKAKFEKLPPWFFREHECVSSIIRACPMSFCGNKAKNMPKNKFCPECGEEITDRSTPVILWNLPACPNNRCRNYGQRLKRTFKHCPLCGEELTLNGL